MSLVRRGLRPELLPLELALIAAIFLGDETGYVPLSKAPFLFLVAWASLRLRGLHWPGGGVARQRHPSVVLALVVVNVAFGLAHV